jgi:integrase
VDGKLGTVLSGVSEAEAQDAADVYAEKRSAEVLIDGVTLEQFGVGFLDRRELAGVRAIRTDRSVWRKHVAGSTLGALRVATLTRRDIVEWRDQLRGAHRSRKKLLNLLRTALNEAVDRELLKANPALTVQIHRSGAARATDDLEGILTPDEQQRLIAAVGLRYRPLVVFALLTGLRQAEQWWLGWDDVFDDRVVIRRSTGGKPPKSGKIREVYLLPAAKVALDAMRRRPGFVFQGTRGGRRQEGKAPLQWRSWLKAAGITRRVRWHDLRHTCATSLLAGWWGRKWSLDEVCKLLGHSSITVTERYARKLNETQRAAVEASPAFLFPIGNPALLSPRSDKASRPFVKHRSSVQIRQSAPILTRGGWELEGNSDGAVTAPAWALALAAERVLKPVASGTIPGTITRRKRGRDAG